MKIWLVNLFGGGWMAEWAQGSTGLRVIREVHEVNFAKQTKFVRDPSTTFILSEVEGLGMTLKGG